MIVQTVSDLLVTVRNWAIGFYIQVSKASDMIERLNMSNANYQQYKNRLRDAGVIDQEWRGVIMITVPRMKEYLRRKYGEE